MQLLTNKKIREYLAKSKKTNMFSKYVGMTRVGVIHKLEKDDLANNMSLQFVDFIIAMFDSGAIITMSKVRYKTASQTEINKEAHRLAQLEIAEWWEKTRGHRRAVAELESRVKKVKEEMASFGI